jgi:hypothetical protein
MSLWYQPLPELQWEQDGFIAQLDPHPLSPSRALVVITIDDLDNLDESIDAPLAAASAVALYECLRLNGDLLLGTGWALVLDDEDMLLLRTDVDLETLDGPGELMPIVNLGMTLAASVRLIWAASHVRETLPRSTP